MRPGNMPRSLGAAMGGHTPAPAATAPAGAPADDFDAFLAQETAKIQDMAKARAQEKGIDLAAAEPGSAEAGQGSAAAAAPKREPHPMVIVWAGRHGEQKPPHGIKWEGVAQMDAQGHGVLATTEVSAVAGAFDVTVRAWRLIVPRHVSHEHFPALVERWMEAEGAAWDQCGGVIVTGHHELVKPLLLASIKREGHPLVLPIKADESMVDPVLYDRKTPPRQREGYKRRWMSRWQT